MCVCVCPFLEFEDIDSMEYWQLAPPDPPPRVNPKGESQVSQLQTHMCVHQEGHFQQQQHVIPW